MFLISKICKAVSDDGKDHFPKYDHDISKMHKFRLLDDDGNVYFYGYNDTCDDEDAFDPLDYYGVDYGCTMIEYKNPETGKYEQL